MMLTTLVPAFLAITAYAFPTPVIEGGCSLPSAVDIPANQPNLTAAAYPISFLALGVGVQNYTCASTGTYSSTGAVAELFDISCIAQKDKSLYKKLPDIAIDAWTHAERITATKLVSTLSGVKNPEILGEHYFITNPVTGTGLSPKWDFTAHAFRGNSSAYVVAAKVGDLPAPTGKQDVDWLKLTGVANEGELAKEIYRTDTRQGQPPASCTPGTADISVKYVAYYWLTGSAFSLADSAKHHYY